MLDADELAAHLWPRGEGAGTIPIHAVLDGAQDPCIERLVRSSGLEHDCLLAGPLEPALRSAAPYLVRLSRRSRLFERLVREGLALHWGVLLIMQGEHTGETLRRHLRSLLRVRDERGGKLLFRFYDPRVLRAYLATCTPEEGARLFGPVRAFALASSPGGRLEVLQQDASVAPAGASPGMSVVRSVHIAAIRREWLAQRLHEVIGTEAPPIAALHHHIRCAEDELGLTENGAIAAFALLAARGRAPTAALVRSMCGEWGLDPNALMRRMLERADARPAIQGARAS